MEVDNVFPHPLIFAVVSVPGDRTQCSSAVQEKSTEVSPLDSEILSLNSGNIFDPNYLGTCETSF